MSDRERGGRFHCLKCGRSHNRNSTIGSYHHRNLDPEKEGFDIKEVAVGVAFINAIRPGRHKPSATVGEIEAKFVKGFEFDEQLPNVSVEDQLREWEDDGLIGEGRHSGKDWYIFLANRRRRSDRRSPESLFLLMKQYAKNLDRAKKR